MAETSTLTIRIPEGLRREMESARLVADQTATDYVIRSMKMRLAGACKSCGRDGAGQATQPIGVTERFERWVLDLGTARKVTIATSEPHGFFVYTGLTSPNGLHDSYLDLEIAAGAYNTVVKLPRAFVLMWERDAEAERFRENLVYRGYRDYSALLLQHRAAGSARGRKSTR